MKSVIRHELLEFPMDKGEHICTEINNTVYIYQYLGNLEFKCVSHPLRVHGDAVLIGSVLKKLPAFRVPTKAELKEGKKRLRSTVERRE